MKTLLVLAVIALIVTVARQQPDVVRKPVATPAPLLVPHVSRLPETRLEPSGKIGERKILYQSSR